MCAFNIGATDVCVSPVFANCSVLHHEQLGLGAAVPAGAPLRREERVQHSGARRTAMGPQELRLRLWLGHSGLEGSARIWSRFSWSFPLEWCFFSVPG